VQPIQIPDDWNDNGLLTFEEFCIELAFPGLLSQLANQRVDRPPTFGCQPLQTDDVF
jgi:hypothetical protein